jgi:hypothetical protein
MKQIKFSQNWNNKLDCNYFTTIRLLSKKYQIGETYEIVENEVTKLNATALDVIAIKTDSLNDFICYLDTGYSKDETIAMFQKMYPKVDLKNTYLALVLLKKI